MREAGEAIVLTREQLTDVIVADQPVADQPLGDVTLGAFLARRASLIGRRSGMRLIGLGSIPTAAPA